MSQGRALTALGSDLTFSVSFAIASEFRDQAVESDISQIELIAVVSLLTIALDRLPDAVELFGVGLTRALTLWRLYCGADSRHRNRNVSAWYVLSGRFASDATAGDGGAGKADDDGANTPKRLLEFVRLFVDIARRICASLLVQLVANAISAREPVRASRIVSLLTITIFFVFLQSGGTFTTRVKDG